uniref:Uncharacterized protein n=1 Tax=Periophthalmus magnuspinnatus TaxID=409849 RepID=A0A3B4AUV3_9GOBI
ALQLLTSVCLCCDVTIGLFLLVPVLMAPTPSSLCTPLKTLNDSLSYRRRYMKHNFPINYGIRVHYEEIFKLSNISWMGLDELTLQRLWFQVNQGILKKLIRVMPERHPSRPYTAELETRLRDAEGVFVLAHPAEVRFLVPTHWRDETKTNKNRKRNIKKQRNLKELWTSSNHFLISLFTCGSNIEHRFSDNA